MTDIQMPPAPPPDPSIFQPPAFDRRRKYTLEADFAPFFSAFVALPNFEPIPHWQALRASMGYGKTIESFRREGKLYDERCEARLDAEFVPAPTYYQDPRGHQTGKAIYHLNCGQGGGFTGDGIVVIDVSGLVQYRAIPESIVTGRFAICKHEKVEGPGANHSRGWHPGWCSKCGLDLSVDSGD